eukprot:CAMPEP_0203697326 /NCGR_PEP_ID=MMETSP0091-20130426/8307_1 /ASSEMBLY_ACC=CAM_ASM_001089 /TAXON_ID=426623 /ORGANISM="Chaetoceros affinis, Strain CCMP159" /LENGTH=160 /DNA_ID=CAMNT_0050569289 /DNA_START=21 /DNA_END=503 /DNA_ORIENTATION=-
MASTTMMMRSIARSSLAQTLRAKVAVPASSVGTLRFSSHFTAAHEYAKTDGKIATCGITDFAQAALGDIVFVDLPEVGDEFEKGDSFGSVESVKAASDVYAPVTGTVVEVNEALSDEPGIVNNSPEEEGWFIKIEMDDESELDDLMTPEAYKEHCESEAH